MLLNADRLSRLMAADGLQAVVATSAENVTYCSGFWALSQWVRRGPQTYVLLPDPKLGEPVIITGTSMLDLIADQKPWVRQVRRFSDFVIERDEEAVLDAIDQHHAELYALPDERTPLAALCNAIGDGGLAAARIGVEELGLTPGYLTALRDAFPGAQFVPADSIFRRCRAVKTEAEIERLRISARIAEQSIAAALEIAREGATERDLALAFHARTVLEGGMPVLGCIGFGTRSAMTNVQPSDRALRPGEIIRFDVGGRYAHYRSDIARIGVLGEPSAKAAAYHRALQAGVRRACHILRPGLAVRDLFDAVVETVRREGLPHYRRTHVGHGIGLDGYDAPDLGPNSSETIEEGMVLCVETPYYELGAWGLQVEDMLVVRADGVESLMQTDGSMVML
ncbi:MULTISPECIES: Xaa-Pro peptidase family protein [Rhodomicrobium]|uniref:M24 family metallopeptidase n=1 Tax=Rhodomicrobium TaxID=1068 RepID=UPI000B4B0E33|nr:MULTISPECIES: Xaa-Pro peptidase family protein [Rhodomicrobium]